MTDNNSAPELPRLTEAMIHAACIAHYGKARAARSGGPNGISLTVNDKDWTFAQGFRRMWSGIRKHLREKDGSGSAAAHADLCAADRGVTVEPLDDTSLSARIREIGNQLHNLGCKHQNDEDLCERLAELRGQLWEIAALQPTEAQPEPVIHAIFETVDLSVPVTGTTAAKVKRIELNDDGSKTVVIDHWPLPPTGNTALVKRAIKLAEWCEEPEQLDDREAGSVIRELVAALASRAAPPEAQVTVAGLTRAIPAEGDTIDRMRANLWVTPEGRTLMNSGDVRLYWLNEGDVNTAALRALGGSN